MKEYQVIGVMSGSSLDGLDIAYCLFYIDPNDESVLPEWRLIEGKTYPFSQDLKERLSRLTSSSALDISLFDIRFGGFIAECITEFLKNTPPLQPDFIASHGHTVFHFPSQHLSVQTGSSAIIAARTGYPCIGDFRQSDVAVGGQGAPLAVLADMNLFPGYSYYLNLGGIANVSMIRKEKILAYDIFAANQMFNALSETLGYEMDIDGNFGRKGKVIPALMKMLSSNEYLDLDPPKSMDNSWVKENIVTPILKFEGDAHDKLTTCYKFLTDRIGTELQIINDQLISDHLFSSMLVTGGGAKNKFLVEQLKQSCNKIGLEVQVAEPLIVDYKEAILMAYMGLLRWLRKPNCLPAATGASKAMSGGAIYLP